MKIRKQKENSVEFRFVESGGVFRRIGGNHYLKIESYRDEHSDAYWNTANLETGEWAHVDDDELVILVDCELVVQ